MKIPHVSLQSKLDELMSLLHRYLLMQITCVAIESVHPGSIAVKHALFHRRIRVGLHNDISSFSFNCSETRVILVEEYVWIIKISFPASIAVKQALFSSLYTQQ